MPRFSIRNPYFILAVCLAIGLIGVTEVARMPVDLFPEINMPEVVVATFYSGMPPNDIETDITNPLERWFTLASGIDHMESRSLLGVSIIRVYFQAGTNADADVAELANLALADLKRLPPGTLPPVVMKFDASSLPVCLVTLQGEGLTETQIHDIGQFTIRNQIAVVKGAEIPPPFGGKYRQAMIYVNPYKLSSRQLGLMDVVEAVNQSNLILPAGDVKIGPYDYYVYSNSLVKQVKDLNDVPIKLSGTSWVSVSDIGEAKDANQIQYNVVRVNGQRSVYLPIMKQGGNTNTIEVVDGVRNMLGKLFDIPRELKPMVAFDQSAFVKEALSTLEHEGLAGLILTSLMILIFLGSLRSTAGVLLSIPLSTLTTFIALYFLGSSINTMILGGLAVVFSRVIDNSVISLENIYRHLEMGSAPEIAAAEGGSEVSLAVLAATLATIVVFFPVKFLYGVSKFLFSALALSVVIALFASYFIAMTVIPLFCAKYLKAAPHYDEEPASRRGFTAWFNRQFKHLLDGYERLVRVALARPGVTVAALSLLFVASLGLFPRVGMAFFPRTDAGQFTINVKVPVGARIEVTERYVAALEDVIRREVKPADLRLLVSNIGVVPDFSALYTTNAGPYTATIQVDLNRSHKISSFEYMKRIRSKLRTRYPEVRTFFSSGSMVDSVLNKGMPAPIDVQISGQDLNRGSQTAMDLAPRIRALPGVEDVYIPQDLDYPAFRINVNRVHAAELGLTQKMIVQNMITALNSNVMIAPNYWVDRQTGNDYFLTVQYYEQGPGAIRDITDLKNIPLRAPNLTKPTTLDTVVTLEPVQTATEVSHYQIQRTMDLYVTPVGEDLGKVFREVQHLIAASPLPEGVHIDLRGMVQDMSASFDSFAKGLLLSLVLLYLILVAQFRSLRDPFLVMLAIPMGFIGVLVVLAVTDTTLNVMSLMGVLMLIGVAASNSILIVEFAHRLEDDGFPITDAVVTACRVRLRPILMTSLATIIGMIPMALKMGTGSEAYTPMARAIIGGLTSSVTLTVFLVPAAYLLVYRGKRGGKYAAAPVEPVEPPVTAAAGAGD